MKKNNWKTTFLTAVTIMSILSGCAKNSNTKDTKQPEAISWFDTLPRNEAEYFENKYDAKILETVPVLNEEISEVLGWVWQNDYCHVLKSNGTYDYVENVDGIKGYVEHKYLEKMQSIPVNQFAYLIDDTETYTGAASRLYPKTGKVIEQYQKVFVLEAYDYFSYCRDDEGNYSYVPNCNLGTLTDTFIETDESEQKSYLYVDGELLLEFYVTTGCDETPTPKGRYQVTVKARNKTLKDGAEVDYWVAFIADLFGYHDASWRSYYDYGTNVYHYYGSHGCVNCPYDAIVIVYENVEVGTPVLIHK